MADKNIFKLEGKSQEQVKEAFLEFLKIDKTKPGGNLGQPWRKIEERVKEIVKGEGRDEW